MKLLDLFCGAGGAAMGYSRAGFDEIVGVDISEQRHYPFRFVRGDALVVLGWMKTYGGRFPIDHPDGQREWLGPFDAIHASPPCHHYSTGTRHRKNQGIVYPDLLPPTQAHLSDVATPFVIENVPGARFLMRQPRMLCGSMFGIGVTRHRYFETNWPWIAPQHECNGSAIDRDAVSITRHGPPARWYKKNPGKVFSIRQWHEAMQIDWMPRFPLTQAIPPAYTEYIGRQLLAHLRSQQERTA